MYAGKLRFFFRTYNKGCVMDQAVSVVTTFAYLTNSSVAQY